MSNQNYSFQLDIQGGSLIEWECYAKHCIHIYITKCVLVYWNKIPLLLTFIHYPRYQSMSGSMFLFLPRFRADWLYLYTNPQYQNFPQWPVGIIIFPPEVPRPPPLTDWLFQAFSTALECPLAGSSNYLWLSFLSSNCT